MLNRGRPSRQREAGRLIAVSLLLLTILIACSNASESNATVIPTIVPPSATTTVPPTETATTVPPAGTATTTLSPQPTTSPTTAATTDEPQIYDYQIVATYPHDPNAFTQGLDIEAGTLYEGTGLNGRSSLRRVELETGEVIQQIDLEPEHFGEGIVVFGDRIFQLTWQSQIAFVYDRETFELLETFTYSTEGWGITSDGQRLIMSDGTSTLVFRDPDTFAELGSVDVTDGGQPVTLLNELEWVDGEVWANVWQSDMIVRINPETGAVVGWIDLTGLLQPEDLAGGAVDVLNGIAIDDASGQLFVTGKLWPVIYEVVLIPR